MVAHELGHVANNDIPRGIAFIAIVAPLGLLFMRELGDAPGERSGVDPASPAALPAYLLALSLATLILSVPGNQLSRQVEASADGTRSSSRMTRGPDRPAAATRPHEPLRPRPSGSVATVLFGTHPPTVERIGAGAGLRARTASAEPST